MSKKRASDNISLTAFDDLFGTPSEGEQIVEVALKDLHEFHNHPFRVLDDEKMEETVASVKEQGIIVPGIVRPLNEGGYEIIAGHRRKRAAELAGLKTMPVYIREYSDEQATCLMVDTNIQREDILLLFTALWTVNSNVLIEPGVIKTDFYTRSMNYSKEEKLTEYEELSDRVSKYLLDGGNNGSDPADVAKIIYRVAESRKRKMQYIVGKSTEIVTLNKLLPNKMVRKLIKKTMVK